MRPLDYGRLMGDPFISGTHRSQNRSYTLIRGPLNRLLRRGGGFSSGAIEPVCTPNENGSPRAAVFIDAADLVIRPICGDVPRPTP